MWQVRICDEGGFVSAEGELNGMIGVSRSLGDCALPPPRCATPALRTYDAGRRPFTLVMASDGLWDHVTPEEARTLLLAMPPAASTAEQVHSGKQCVWVLVGT